MREPDEAERSGSTAQFRAFVDESGGPEATQAWSMHAQRNHRVATLSAIVAGIVVVLILIAVLVIR